MKVPEYVTQIFLQSIGGVAADVAVVGSVLLNLGAIASAITAKGVITAGTPVVCVVGAPVVVAAILLSGASMVALRSTKAIAETNGRILAGTVNSIAITPFQNAIYNTEDRMRRPFALPIFVGDTIMGLTVATVRVMGEILYLPCELFAAAVGGVSDGLEVKRQIFG